MGRIGPELPAGNCRSAPKTQVLSASDDRATNCFGPEFHAVIVFPSLDVENHAILPDNPPDAGRDAGVSRYDVACRALAAAKAVDDVMEVVAHADAVRVYARQAKNRQMEIDAAEIRIRAERRLGELMAAQRSGRRRRVQRGACPKNRVGQKPAIADSPPTLAEAGIDKNLAQRARTYAAVPPEKFEQLLTDKRQGENRRVVLDPEVQAEAEATRDRSGATPHRPDRRRWPGRENDRLARQVAELRRRIAALIEENGALKDRETMWRERALAAGWTELAA